MLQVDAAAQSRWVLRTLWLVAAAVFIAILTVRTSPLRLESQRLVDSYGTTSALAFSAPISQHDFVRHFDSIGWADHPAVAIRPGISVKLPAGSTVTISGWAFDTAAKLPFAGIGAKVDRGPAIASASLKLVRPDVATALADQRARDSGFALDIDTAHLSLGKHVVLLRALRSNGGTAATLGSIAFTVGRQAVALQNTDSIDAVNGVVISSVASLTTPLIVLRSIGRLTIDGWGFVTDGERLGNSMSILVDGNVTVAGRYGLPRSDVAEVYHDIRVARSGFEGVVPLSALPGGIHLIKVRLGLSDGTTVDSASSIRINLR